MGISLIDAGSVIDSLSNAINKVFPNEVDKLKAQAIIETLRQQPDALQVEINKIEAASPNWFVSGWRPAVGWICASAIAYEFVIRPFVQLAISLSGNVIQAPALEMQDLLGLLSSMMGLSYIRMQEKKSNVARN